MTSITTVTQKGQVTIPLWLRQQFDLSPYDRVQIQAGKGHIKILPVEDLLDIAGRYKAPKGKTALKARDYMEKHYKRA